MDFGALDYFLRVAELGSINKAAADLRLSQPALSRHIALLEHEMATQLFNRTQSGVTLTEAGQELAERARPLLRQLTLLKEQVGEKASGRLAFGVPPAWHHVFTSQFVTRMLAACPGVSLRIFEDVSHVLREYMLSGALDVCIIPFEGSQTPGYRQTALVKEPLVLVGTRQDGLTPDAPVSLSRLDGTPLIVPAPPNFLRGHIEQQLAREGMSFKVAVETDGLALSLDLASRGAGYPVVPASATTLHQLPDNLSWTPIRGMFIVWALRENEARTHSQAVREARRLVLGTVAETLASHLWFGAEAMAT